MSPPGGRTSRGRSSRSSHATTAASPFTPSSREPSRENLRDPPVMALPGRRTTLGWLAPVPYQRLPVCGGRASEPPEASNVTVGHAVGVTGDARDERAASAQTRTEPSSAPAAQWRRRRDPSDERPTSAVSHHGRGRRRVPDRSHARTRPSSFEAITRRPSGENARPVVVLVEPRSTCGDPGSLEIPHANEKVEPAGGDPPAVRGECERLDGRTAAVEFPRAPDPSMARDGRLHRHRRRRCRSIRAHREARAGHLDPYSTRG